MKCKDRVLAFGSTLEHFLDQTEIEITCDVFEVFLKEVTLDLCFEGLVGIRWVKKYKGELQNEGSVPVSLKSM